MRKIKLLESNDLSLLEQDIIYPEYIYYAIENKLKWKQEQGEQKYIARVESLKIECEEYEPFDTAKTETVIGRQKPCQNQKEYKNNINLEKVGLFAQKVKQQRSFYDINDLTNECLSKVSESAPSYNNIEYLSKALRFDPLITESIFEEFVNRGE